MDKNGLYTLANSVYRPLIADLGLPRARSLAASVKTRIYNCTKI